MPNELPDTLRAVPNVVLQALQQLSDPEFSGPELAALLRNDPGIVAKLLSVINSAANGLPKRVSNVQDVVTLLGKSTIVSLLLAGALAPADDIPERQRPFYRKYWIESVVMGTSVELLGRCSTSSERRGLKPSDYFTCGLLADVGRLALLQSHPGYIDILEEARLTDQFPRDVEKARLAGTHLTVSLGLLHSWSMPGFILDAVAHHHDTLEEIRLCESTTHPHLAKALMFSAAMIDSIAGSGNIELTEQLIDIGSRSLNLTESEVTEHVACVMERMSETSHLFAISSTDVEAIRATSLAGLNAAAAVAVEQTGAGSKQRLMTENAELSRRLESMEMRVSHDDLTGLFNREYFNSRLTQHLQCDDRSLGLLFIDVDEFKVINDSHGHVVGDAVLRGIATAIQGSVRQPDLCARYAGDEFVVLVTNVSAFGLQRLGERLLNLVASTKYTSGHDAYSNTVSVGGAFLHANSSTRITNAEFISMADAAMYEVKKTGKQRVHVAECIGDSGPSRVLEGPSTSVADRSASQTEIMRISCVE